MNGTRPQIERVALTEAEMAYLAPIWDRFQQAQQEINSVAQLFFAGHADELNGHGWQLAKDCFARAVPAAQPAQPYSNGNGQHEPELVTAQE